MRFQRLLERIDECAFNPTESRGPRTGVASPRFTASSAIVSSSQYSFGFSSADDASSISSRDSGNCAAIAASSARVRAT